MSLHEACASFREAVAEIKANRRELPFACGNCGERFATKGRKRRHKLECDAPAREQLHEDGAFSISDADLYGRIKISPEIKARAAAEWLAMDEYGKLPEGRDPFAGMGEKS